MNTIKNIVSKIFHTLFNFQMWVHLPKTIVVSLVRLGKFTFQFLAFFILLGIFLIQDGFRLFCRIPLLGKVGIVIGKAWSKTLQPVITKLINGIEAVRPFEVKRSYLIFLAIENLRARKSRSFITIAGMSAGVGIIVLLLSLGYGIERLVISQVASLDELKIVDVSTGTVASQVLNKSTLDKIKKIPNVANAIPLISVVGRITYNKATTDVLVYVAPNEYLDIIKLPIRDKMKFTNNNFKDLSKEGEVAGVSVELPHARINTPIKSGDLYFSVQPEKSVTVWSECRTNSEVLGETTRIEGDFVGKEYWGNEYYPYNDYGRSAYDSSEKRFLGKWVKTRVPLFISEKDGVVRPVLDDYGRHEWVEGCIEQSNIVRKDFYKFGDVLGDATESASLTPDEESTDSALVTFDTVVVSTDSAGLEMVELQATDSANTKEESTINFISSPKGEAMVSVALLKLFNIPENTAVGTKFSVSYIITSSLLPEVKGKAKTTETEYTIIGVIDDTESEFFYINFADMQRLGVKNYSQLKVVLEDQKHSQSVRNDIQVLGFQTTSTADTVTQIELLFNNLRIVLGLLGLVALGVASLGMFNTLTVSLLERTREIGGMKTMGMVSEEVQDLFLAEAMIMGLSGGIGGIILGFLAGKMLSFSVSAFAFTQGEGFLELTYIPMFLIIFIIVSSFIVGLITGLYPAYRAKKISALNALRYE